MTPKSKSGKAYAARRKTEAARKKAKSAATAEKKRLGDSSLDWIADTTEREAVLQEAESPQAAKDIEPKETKIEMGKHFEAEQAGGKPESDTTEREAVLQEDESPQAAKDIEPKEAKIGMGKHFDAEQAGGKPESAPATRLGISANSSTITKGRTMAGAAKKEISVEEVKRNLGEEKVAPLPAEPARTARAKKTPSAKVPVKAAGKIKAPAAASPAKAAWAEKTPTAKAPKAPVEKVEAEAPHIPDDSSTIVTKKSKAARKEAKAGEAKKAPARVKAPAPVAAFKEKVAVPARKSWSKIAELGAPLVKGGRKVSETAAKPFKSGKLKESVGSALKAAKQPVKAVAALDRGIARSLKKAALFDAPGKTGKSLIDNLRETDARITKSVKDLIDSIF
ncbi:MAG: hypothetical protein FVQ81_04975 [Candidatus Glassbacteria bacterium]|nr:hypothetical protein [Candidatus Glassbacteria bacterium]